MHVAGIPALYFGTLAFVVAVVLVLWRVHRAFDRGADEARVLVVASAVVSLLAYILLTRMHERYMFLALACLSPLVFTRSLRLAYAGLCGLFVLNLWYALRVLQRAVARAGARAGAALPLDVRRHRDRHLAEDVLVGRGHRRRTRRRLDRSPLGRADDDRERSSGDRAASAAGGPAPAAARARTVRGRALRCGHGDRG